MRITTNIVTTMIHSTCVTRLTVCKTSLGFEKFDLTPAGGGMAASSCAIAVQMFSRSNFCLPIHRSKGLSDMMSWTRTLEPAGDGSPRTSRIQTFPPTWARPRNGFSFFFFLCAPRAGIWCLNQSIPNSMRDFPLHPGGGFGIMRAEVRGREHKYTCPGSIISHGGWIKDLGWIATLARAPT